MKTMDQIEEELKGAKCPICGSQITTKRSYGTTVATIGVLHPNGSTTWHFPNIFCTNEFCFFESYLEEIENAS